MKGVEVEVRKVNIFCTSVNNKLPDNEYQVEAEDWAGDQHLHQHVQGHHQPRHLEPLAKVEVQPPQADLA